MDSRQSAQPTEFSLAQFSTSPPQEPHITLDEVLLKAEQFEVDLRALRIVHLDDDTFILKHAQEMILPHVRSYIGFTKPKDALEYILEHSGDIDALILDQFLTEDLRFCEGYQGTDIIKTLQERNIILPTVLFSGEYATTNLYPLLMELNKTETIFDYLNRVWIERKGNMAPLAFVDKSEGSYAALMNIVGLVAIKARTLDNGYAHFIKSLAPTHPDSQKYVYAKLAYKKGRILYEAAVKFSERFRAEVDPEADIPDRDGTPFSQSFLHRCGFKFGSTPPPEHILGYESNEMEFFAHTFSRAHRSVLPNIEGSANIEGFYRNLLYEKVKVDTIDGVDFKHLLEIALLTPKYAKAVALIKDFKRETACLGLELYSICRELDNQRSLDYEKVSAFTNINTDDISYHIGIGRETLIITNYQTLKFTLEELAYNAVKVGQARGIKPHLNVAITQHGFTELPQSVQEQFSGYDLPKPSFEGIPPESVESAAYIRYSIADNCGGFENLEGSLERGVSQTGSSGIGLSAIMAAKSTMLCGIEIINRTGEGATVNLYFMRGERG